MIKALISILICYGVCYGYPADHFVTFFSNLQKIERDFFKSSTMLTKFTDKSSSEIDAAKNISKKDSEVSICCVVCHGGPADHFATLLPELQKKGVQLHIHATPGVIEKFKEVDLQVHLLNINNTSLSEIDVARKLAKECSKVSVLLTDLGNSFEISLQQAFKEYNPHIKRLVYYDNPESYVPGGYSEIADATIQIADRVLFSNSNLTRSPLYINKEKESDVPFDKRFGIGYYPMFRVQEIRKKRLEEKKTNSMRLKFFHEHQIQGKDKKLLVYFGGNNDEYYKFAFPAFQKFLANSIERSNLSDLVFVIHQHPAAKNSNRDWNYIKAWVEEIGNNSKAPTIILSQWDSNQMQIIADCALYYQTSMAAQFALSGIPTMQIGHEIYQDILVKNKAIPSIVNTDDFLEILVKGNWESSQSDLKSLIEYLGIRHDCCETLMESIK